MEIVAEIFLESWRLLRSLIRYFCESLLNLYRVLAVLKAPLIIVATFFFVTQFAGQLPELILGYRQLPTPWAAARAAALSIYFLCFLLAAYSLELIMMTWEANPSAYIWTRRVLISTVIVVISSVPLFALVLALLDAETLAVSNRFAAELPDTLESLISFRWKHVIGVSVMILFMGMLTFVMLKENGTLRFTTFWFRRVALFHLAPFFALLLWGTVLCFVHWSPNRIRTGGALYFIVLFFVIWTILFCSIYYRYSRRAVPIITIFLGWFVFINWFDLNDHHLVSLRAVSVPADGQNAPFEIGTPQIPQQVKLREWLANRDPERPIYVIAAQGGGIYAAYHAALVIAHLIGPEHGIENDIFAISAVSGGSVGSAMAIALRYAIPIHQETDAASKESQCRSAWRRHDQLLKAIDLAFHKDYASTVAVAGAYVDTVLGVLPISAAQLVFPERLLQRDRALYLERALVQGFVESIFETVGQWPEKSLLDVGINRYRDIDQFAPYLIFNVVSGTTGDRNYITPSDFEFDLGADSQRPGTIEKRSITRALSGLHLSLITAAVLSSRFPFVTPPASLKNASDKNAIEYLRFVDGGYFDNSGVATALDIIREVQRYTPGTPIRLIALGGLRNPRSRTMSFNDLITPIQTMLLTRVARGEDYMEDAKSFLTGRNGVIELRASPPNVNLTLGWFLSQNSLRYVREVTEEDFRELSGLGHRLCDRP